MFTDKDLLILFAFEVLCYIVLIYLPVAQIELSLNNQILMLDIRTRYLNFLVKNGSFTFR